MLLWRRNTRLNRGAAILAAAIAAAVVLPAAPSAAQNLFEAIFGSHRAPPPPPRDALPFADPFTSLMNELERPHARSFSRYESGPARAFCVRTCDGRYFPITATGGASPAAMCQAFCPASEARIFSGGAIDYAVAQNGKRYADLKNAYLYRARVVPGCTCNGRDAFGLARIDVAGDPTLRRGDIVATRNGLAAFAGTRNRAAQFTPVELYRGFSKSYREKLSDLEIMPPNMSVPSTTPMTRAPRAETTGSGSDRHARLSR